MNRHPFELSIEQSIAANHLLDPTSDKPVIATLSGGADSVALLAALTALGYRCVAAHCNFHLRGEESMRDEHHARMIAQSLGADFHLKDFDVHAYRTENGGSIEMICRQLRYEWFEELKSTTDAQAIAVAHHSDDNIETFFLNLLRGTSLHGLSGMAPRNDTGTVRPMLATSRTDVEQYLAYRGIPFITDSTNLTNDYKRNKIRNLILPAINNEFPGASNAIAATLRHLQANEALYNALINEKMEGYNSEEGINISRLTKEQNDKAALLLFEYLKPMGLSYSQAESICSAAALSGQKYVTPEATFILDHGMLRRASQEEKVSDSDIEMSIIPREEFQPVRDGSEAYFDISVLDGAPLTVRPWQKGDRIKPYGMRGSKKVSDIFTDAKVPVDRKSGIPIVTKDDRILWVAGLRASSHYPVTDATRRIVVLKIRKQS